MTRVPDSAYTCPRCGTDRGNTPRDLPCPNCELTLEEAQRVADQNKPAAEPGWLARQNALAPLVIEYVRLDHRLDRMQSRWSRRKSADSSDPCLDRMTLVINQLRSKQGQLWLKLIQAGLKYGELPKLRALIAEGRLPRTS